LYTCPRTPYQLTITSSLGCPLLDKPSLWPSDAIFARFSSGGS
jgi:hypothetical protein